MELTPNQLDSSLMGPPPALPDTRKPIRAMVDDKIIPNLSTFAAPPMAAIAALSHLQRVPKIINVQ